MARKEFEAKVENYGVSGNRILMFGINVGQIAKGWVNDALKLE